MDRRDLQGSSDTDWTFTDRTTETMTTRQKTWTLANDARKYIGFCVFVWVCVLGV